MQFRRRSISLLLIFAMLTVLVAAIVPFVSSADPEEPEEFAYFGYQTPNGYKMINATTALRFVFQVPASKLAGYTDAGFVFSKSVSEPTTATGAVFHATTVYRSITADGNTVDADDGGFWVAVKLNNIPQSYYDGDIYVRAFVTDGEGTRYSAVKTISVRDANATERKWIEGKKYPQKRDGTDGTSNYYDDFFSFSAILGDKHFYPTDDNPEGNDLLIEYSLLWNDTLKNTDSRVYAILNNNNGPKLSWMTFIGNQAQDSCTYPGGFETTGGMSTILYGPARMGLVDEYYSDYPNVGGVVKHTEEGHEWGWHRVGVRFHQELTNKDAVKDEGADPAYTMTSTVYIDGVRVCKIGNDGAFSAIFGSDASNALYTAKRDGQGHIQYTDNTSNKACGLYVSSEANATGTAYLVYSNLSVTCGRDFVQNVIKAESPSLRTYKTADGESLPATVYYTLPAAEPIVYASNMDAATRSALPYTSGSDVKIAKTITEIRGYAHFYPAYKYKLSSTLLSQDYNDVLVECSFLWNETLSGRDGSLALQGKNYMYDLINVNTQNGTITVMERDGASFIYPTPAAIAVDPSLKTVSIGGYGWHRLGFRLHQEASKSGSSAVYSYTLTAYLDGERIFEINRDGLVSSANDYCRFFEASVSDKKLTFTDPSKVGKIYLSYEGFFTDGEPNYLVLRDVYITCGRNFVQQVVPVASPSTGAKITLGGNEYSAETYYRLAD